MIAIFRLLLPLLPGMSVDDTLAQMSDLNVSINRAGRQRMAKFYQANV